MQPSKLLVTLALLTCSACSRSSETWHLTNLSCSDPTLESKLDSTKPSGGKIVLEGSGNAMRAEVHTDRSGCTEVSEYVFSKPEQDRWIWSDPKIIGSNCPDSGRKIALGSVAFSVRTLLRSKISALLMTASDYKIGCAVFVRNG